MSDSLTHTLNEHLRDAMLAFYLTAALAEDATIKRLKLAETLKTTDDLYAHWLIDPQVSQAVPTTLIASAITSLQHYITAIFMGIEPGYETGGIGPSQEKTWNDTLQTYSLWRAHQQLRHYPASYLSPSLRQGKTDSFQQLENELSQFRIEAEPLSKAVQGYLNRFEELASIKTLNGYIDGDTANLADSVYYFVGKSRSENTFYWRSLDLSQRDKAASNATHKPYPTAWSNWKKIHLPLGGEPIPEQSIRPVFFNGRLFVVWVECIKPLTPLTDFTPLRGRGETETENEYAHRLETQMRNHYVQLRMNFSFCKLDGSWSAPQTCIQDYCVLQSIMNLNKEQLMGGITSLAFLDTATQPSSLFLGLCAVPEASDAPSRIGESATYFYQAVQMDQHFNISWVQSIGGARTLWPWKMNPELAGRYLTLFAQHNKRNFQFRAPQTSQVRLKHVHNLTPHPGSDGWDFDRTQDNIGNLGPDDIQLNTTTSVIEVTSRLAKSFESHRTVTLTSLSTLASFTLILSTRKKNGDTVFALGDASKIVFDIYQPILDIASTSIRLTFDYKTAGISHTDFIRDKDNASLTLVFPATGLAPTSTQSGLISLSNAFISQETFEYFFNTPDAPSLIKLAFHDCTGDKRHLRDVHLNNCRVMQAQRRYKPVLMYPVWQNHALPLHVHRGNTVLIGMTENPRHDLHDTFTELLVPHPLKLQVELDPATLRPYAEKPNGNETITLINGVLILETSHQHSGATILGYALKAVSVAVDIQRGGQTLAIPVAPGIRLGPPSSGGTAEFIDFKDSIITDTGPDLKRAPIRTNTCVANLLTKTANDGLHRLLALPSHTWREPTLLKGSDDKPLDFQGAYSRYFWELFLYLPWLLAHRLNVEHQHAEAESWLRYLFEPANTSTTLKTLRDCWRLPALLHDQVEPNYAMAAPNDPNQLALGNPVYFRQALYLLYVDILLNRGDAAYRRLTRDSLAEAKLCYIRTKRLLGPRPPVNPIDPWSATTLGQLKASTFKPSPKADTSTVTKLCRSLSADLLMRWDKVEARLHNLRHYLDLTGNPLNLQLYAATLTPQMLLTAYAHGGGAPRSVHTSPPPHNAHYRFNVILGYALQMVDNLTQLGTTLLSLLERKEHAQLLETQQQHAWELATLSVEQQAQALQLDTKNRQALLAGRKLVQGRVTFFETQLKAGLTQGEVRATEEYRESAKWELAAAGAQAAAGLAMLLPNIFGTANGGVRFEGAFHATHAALQGMANDKRSEATGLDRCEQFARRAQEWQHALDQARLELAQVDAQLKAYTQQEDINRLQLRLAEASLAQARTLYDMLGKRFTASQLYQWLNDQLASVYFQAYDSTLSLCLTAQACWQEERAQWDQHFIAPHQWSNKYRGLSAGEGLKLNLLTMSNAYLTHNERLLEICKTVSLRQLCEREPAATEDQTWEAFHAALVSRGSVTFKLTHKAFENDYPNHYLRRIKTVSVSLPATLGPYEDVKALLTQTASTVYLTPSAAANAPARHDLRVRQEIALSNGLNDSGLFTLSFENDERYLPFEYTGAISSWQLTFPNHKDQNALLNSLTDIIVHVRYTAKRGGQQ